ncbi:uncharacterized protein LOC131329320 [Rhododendron vialii]|uniref:uncharacterized protein LOC131329320 n=1 Tax=Rhododendron vialii TaxID=182163 RepID=UPI00265DCBA3|nr:uncharacterized protein LOC131329320 [Rhododendron vialii]
MVTDKVRDRILVVFLAVFAVAAPLDAGLLLLFRDGPSSSSPLLLYSKKYGEYLATQKPAFFVALLWIEVAFQWPLAAMILYGLLRRPQPPQWFRSIALVFGASYCTSMITVAAELKWSFHTVSPALLIVYLLLIGCGVLVILRGLLPCPAESTPTNGTRLESRSSENKKGT